MSKNTKFSASHVAYPKTESANGIIFDDNLPIKDVIIGVTNPDKRYKIARAETNDVFIIEYVLEGEGEITLGDETYKVKKGDTYILLPYEKHSYKASGTNPYKKVWINFNSKYIYEMAKAYGLTSGVYKTDSFQIFNRLIELSKSDKNQNELFGDMAACIHELIVNLAISKLWKNDNVAYDIRSALDGAIYKSVNLTEIADKFNMSISSLIRIFKKEFGLTPYAYLLKAKMNTAKLLLINTENSVKEICFSLGICDEHYFSSLFLKYSGFRPTEYRKKMRRNE